MWPLLTLIAVFQNPVPGATPQATSAPTTQSGPTRLEMLGMQEVRRREQMPDQTEKTTLDLLFKFRMAGARIVDVKRHTSVYVTEAVDNVGNSLAEPDALEKMAQELPRRATSPQEGAGLDLPVVKIRAPARSAAVLSKFRGQMRVIYAPSAEGVYLDNPVQYQGRVLEHPRLKELGIEISVLPPDDPKQFASSKKHIAFRVEKGVERVQEIKLCDPYLREIRTKTTPGKNNAGNDCFVVMAGEDLKPDMTLVVEVYPTVEDSTVTFDLDGLKLP